MAKGIKTGGRQKGTANKLSGTVKQMITQYVTEEIQNFPSLLGLLEPKEKAEYLIKLLPYVIPKEVPKDEFIESLEERRANFVRNVMSQYTPKIN